MGKSVSNVAEVIGELVLAICVYQPTGASAPTVVVPLAVIEPAFTTVPNRMVGIVTKVAFTVTALAGMLKFRVLPVPVNVAPPVTVMVSSMKFAAGAKVMVTCVPAGAVSRFTVTVPPVIPEATVIAKV